MRAARDDFEMAGEGQPLDRQTTGSYEQLKSG